MKISPSQRQMTEALKKIWQALGGTFTMCLMLAASAFGDVTRDTEWQDVPPETKIGVVVDLGQGASDPNAVTNICTNGVSIVANKAADIYAPVKAIVESESVTNEGAVAVAKADAEGKYLPADDYDDSEYPYLSKKVSTGVLYSYALFVTDWSVLSCQGGYQSLPAYLDSLEWRTTSNRTLENYGIADAYTKGEVDSISNGAVVAAKAESLLIGKTNDVGRAFALVDSARRKTIIESNYAKLNPIDKLWLFHGRSDSSSSLHSNGGDYIEITPDAEEKKVVFKYSERFGVPERSELHIDCSDVLTANLASNLLPIVTNAYTKGEVDALTDYALTNLVGTSIALASGQIGTVTLSNVQTNIAVALNFSTASDRSGDCLLYIVNGGKTAMSVGPASVTTVGWDGADLNAGTNLVMFTRVKRDGQQSLVMVSTKEVK